MLEITAREGDVGGLPNVHVDRRLSLLAQVGGLDVHVPLLATGATPRGEMEVHTFPFYVPRPVKNQQLLHRGGRRSCLHRRCCLALPRDVANAGGGTVVVELAWVGPVAFDVLDGGWEAPTCPRPRARVAVHKTRRPVVQAVEAGSVARLLELDNAARDGLDRASWLDPAAYGCNRVHTEKAHAP